MAKLLKKLRIYRVLLHFQSCHSTKDPAAALPPDPIRQPHVVQRNRSFTTPSSGGNCCRRRPLRRQEFEWHQDANFHVLTARVQDLDGRMARPSSDGSGSVKHLAAVEKRINRRLIRRKNNNKKKTKKNRTAMPSRKHLGNKNTTSDSIVRALFSNEDEDQSAETTTHDDDDVNVNVITSSCSRSSTRKVHRLKKRGLIKPPPIKKSLLSAVLDQTSGSPARVSLVLRALVPWRRRTMMVEELGKVRESVAVVKTTEDPYEDFRRSMMEMIVEKEMFEEADLDQLLHCFLSLNSCRHHRLIFEAFSDIYHALFQQPCQ